MHNIKFVVQFNVPRLFSFNPKVPTYLARQAGVNWTKTAYQDDVWNGKEPLAMKIVLDADFKSLQPFEMLDVHEFSLLTGINGSGKSQFLEGIAEGRIIVHNDDGMRLSKFSRFTAADFLPSAKTKVTPFDPRIARRIDACTAEFRAEALSWLRERGLEMADIPSLMPGGYPEMMTFSRDFMELALRWNQAVTSKVTPYIPHLERVASQFNKPISLLSRRDLDSASLPMESFGSLSFANACEVYRNLKHSNRLLRMLNEEGDFDLTADTDAEFSERYGPAPWVIINEILQTLGIDAALSVPDPLGNEEYNPKLLLPSGDHMHLDQLSSGEKIILSMGLIGYYADAQLTQIDVPQVVLLDEVDAPLHPSMVRMFLSTISETLVKRFGCKVILTTHSPTTVALFPTDQIWVQSKKPCSVLRTTRQTALNSLTVGVPTLSLDFTGVRQVFCEDDNDANVYSTIYQYLKEQIGQERSLVFMSSGFKSSNGSGMNSGCQAVSKIIESLQQAKNKSAIGLIDGDSVRGSNGRLFVIGNGVRYALENYVFDPLLIAALIVKQFSKHRIDIGVEDFNSGSFYQASEEQLQLVVNNVQKAIFSDKYSESDNMLEVKYVGGRVLRISPLISSMNAHEFGDAVLQAFIGFKSLTKGASSNAAHALLMQFIAQEVIREFPLFVPSAFVETFSEMLTKEL